MEEKPKILKTSRREYVFTKGRVSLFLNGILAASFLLAYILAFLFTSCDYSDFSAEIREDKDTTSFEMTLTKAAGTDVSSLDIFIFNDDSLKALDSHQRISQVQPGVIRACSRSGKKLLFLLANIPEGSVDWARASRYESFQACYAKLSDENSQTPVMTAKAALKAGSEKNVSLTLEPMLAQIKVRSISCDFSGKPYSGQTLKNVRFYLTNASGQCEFGMARVPSIFLNSGKLDPAELSTLKDRTLLLHDYGKEIGARPVNPGTILHAYPNINEENDIGKPVTRLVIEGEIDGTTYYYPINLKLEKNVSYEFDITINRKGTLDADTPIEVDAVTINCSAKQWTDKGSSIITFSVHAPKDDGMISDLNLFVFDEKGNLEDRLFLKKAETELKLLKGCHYDIYACANLGYALYMDKKEDLKNYRYWLAYPDEITRGIPMCGKMEGFECGGSRAELQLERMMSRIKVVVDRRKLDSSVKLLLTDARIGNCPRSALLFGSSHPQTTSDIFSTGYTESFGTLDSLTLYQMENIGGKREDPRGQLCSYVEIRAEYYSNLYYTKPGEYLKYRFYLMDDGKYNVERNASYRYVITPEGTGLNSEDSWKTDKSALEKYTRGTLTLHPSSYIRGDIGEKIHVWCEVYPPQTPFDPGLEDLEEEKKNGIWDYELDGDKKGVTLTLKKPGTGLLYMEAGEPVNDGALVVVEVNLQKSDS